MRKINKRTHHLHQLRDLQAKISYLQQWLEPALSASYELDFYFPIEILINNALLSASEELYKANDYLSRRINVLEKCPTKE